MVYLVSFCRWFRRKRRGRHNNWKIVATRHYPQVHGEGPIRVLHFLLRGAFLNPTFIHGVWKVSLGETRVEITRCSTDQLQTSSISQYVGKCKLGFNVRFHHLLNYHAGRNFINSILWRIIEISKNILITCNQRLIMRYDSSDFSRLAVNNFRSLTSRY
jgi:hypothetical protein